jgi:hypothetical protein
MVEGVVPFMSINAAFVPIAAEYDLIVGTDKDPIVFVSA